MDYRVGLAFSLPIGLGLAGLGCGLGLGLAIGRALEAMGRQPESANKLFINMTIGCAFIESIAIYVLVFVFILLGKL